MTTPRRKQNPPSILPDKKEMRAARRIVNVQYPSQLIKLKPGKIVSLNLLGFSAVYRNEKTQSEMELLVLNPDNSVDSIIAKCTEAKVDEGLIDFINSSVITYKPGDKGYDERFAYAMIHLKDLRNPVTRRKM